MDIETYYLSSLSDNQVIIQNLTDILEQLTMQQNSLEILCVVLLLTACLNFVFFNRRV